MTEGTLKTKSGKKEGSEEKRWWRNVKKNVSEERQDI